MMNLTKEKSRISKLLIIEWYENTGSAPRKFSKDVYESRLGHRCAHYCSSTSSAYDPEFKKMLVDRFNRPDPGYKGFPFKDISKREKIVEEIITFVKNNKRLPSRCSPKSNEQRLYKTYSALYCNAFHYKPYKEYLNKILQAVSENDYFYGIKGNIANYKNRTEMNEILSKMEK
jgi:hypothetical protein